MKKSLQVIKLYEDICTQLHGHRSFNTILVQVILRIHVMRLDKYKPVCEYDSLKYMKNVSFCC